VKGLLKIYAVMLFSAAMFAGCGGGDPEGLEGSQGAVIVYTKPYPLPNH
jgi:hypothetical protein